MKKIFICCVLMAFMAVMRVWANESAVDWEAQWIWQDQNGPTNAWVAFRKDLKISKVPATVIANISADSKYWMWINGERKVQPLINCSRLMNMDER